MLKRYEDSKNYLMANLDLVCEDTANYLVVWCIDLEIEEVNAFSLYIARLFFFSLICMFNRNMI